MTEVNPNISSREPLATSHKNDEIVNLDNIDEELNLEMLLSSLTMTELEANFPIFEEKEDSSPETITETVDTLAANKNWSLLEQKLREQNRTLIKNVVKLEQALTDTQQQLQIQVKRSRSADTLVAQQAAEINKTQEQINHLRQELETSQNRGQRQQLMIDSLSQQLKSSQEQLAQFERDCALLKEDCHEKTGKLLSAEKQVQELRSRLHRQQRFTLQYKTALEQSSDSQNLLSHSSSTGIQPWSNEQKKLPPSTQTIGEASAVSLDDEQEPRGEIILQTTASLEVPVPQSNVELDISELESDDELFEFLEELNNTQSNLVISDRPIHPPTKTTLSPLIYPVPETKQRKVGRIVELPSFLRNRQQKSP
jgi:chromosome segregation ATPase